MLVEDGFTNSAYNQGYCVTGVEVNKGSTSLVRAYGDETAAQLWSALYVCKKINDSLAIPLSI